MLIFLYLKSCEQIAGRLLTSDSVYGHHPYKFPYCCHALELPPTVENFYVTSRAICAFLFVDSYMISWAGLAGVETAVLLNQSLV